MGSLLGAIAFQFWAGAVGAVDPDGPGGAEAEDPVVVAEDRQDRHRGGLPLPSLDPPEGSEQPTRTSPDRWRTSPRQ